MDLISSLRSFLRVAETGSFSAVAAQRGVTQPAISRQVGALEDYLGTQLVQRSTQAITLTEEGKNLLAPAQELVEAVRKALVDGVKAEDVDEGWISSVLYTAGEPDPDLLIRTSGEARISNFLLYQLAYAELYFTGTFWPDFDEAEYAKALADYAGRDRRFGGV